MAALLVALSVMSIMPRRRCRSGGRWCNANGKRARVSGASSACRRSNCSRAEPADSRHRSTCSATVVSFENSTKIRSPMATSSLCIWARLAWVACRRAWPAAAAAGTRSRIVRGAGQQQSSPGTGGSPLTGATSQLPSPTGRGLAPASPFGQASTPGAGPIIGVSSRSTAQSLRLYNGRNHYNEWLFVSTAATRDAGRGAGRRRAWAFPGVEVAEAAAAAAGAWSWPGTAPDGLNRGGPTRGPHAACARTRQPLWRAEHTGAGADRRPRAILIKSQVTRHKAQGTRNKHNPYRSRADTPPPSPCPLL